MSDPSAETAAPQSEGTRSFGQRCFARYARLCVARPKSVCAAGVAFILCCLPGFLLLEFEGSDTIFFLRNTYSTAAAGRNEELFNFDPTNSAVSLWFVAKDDVSLLSSPALRDVGRIVDRLQALETHSGTRLADVCEDSWRGFCETESVFQQFNSSAASLGVTLSAQPSMGEVEGLAVQLLQFCESSPAACRAFLAPQERFTVVTTASSDGSSPPRVASFAVQIFLDQRKDGFAAWMSRVLSEVHAPSYTKFQDNLQTDDFYVINWSKSAREVEAQRPAEAEAHLMAITFLLINVFAWSAITSPTSPRSRGLLSACCMVVVLLSLSCAVGLSAYVGVPLTTMAALVVFTLFGVSVDDIIVIVHAYDRIPGPPTAEDFEERLAESVQDSGPAITLTSATSLVAFLCSALAPIPVITWFCVTAAFGIASVFLLQLTIFLPMFVLDERRRLLGRRDCCLSACLGPLPALAAADDAERTPMTRAAARPRGAKWARVLAAPSVGGGCGVMDGFARLVAGSRAAQVSVALLFAASVGVSGWGASKASTDGDLSDYYIDTSFARQHFDVQRELWASPSPFYFVIEHRGEGKFDDQRRGEIDEVFQEIQSLPFTQGPYVNWLTDFEAYLANRSDDSASLEALRASLVGDAEAFGARVAEFLDAPSFMGPGGALIVPWMHKRNVVLEGGVVRHSRLGAMYDIDVSSQPVYIGNFFAIMEVMFPSGFDSELTNPRVPNTFGAALLFQVAERDDRIKAIIFENLGIACAAVTFTVMVMLSPLVGLFVGVLVACLDVVILAMLTAYGSKLDIVAFLCLSMNIGLVVDYSTHTAFTYLNHPGDPDEKLYASVSKTGASVLSGGGSTLLGVCVLAFASSQAFRTFFYVLGTAILMGTLVGITVSPVFLRIFHGVGRAVARRARCRRCAGCRKDSSPRSGGSAPVQVDMDVDIDAQSSPRADVNDVETARPNLADSDLRQPNLAEDAPELGQVDVDVDVDAQSSPRADVSDVETPQPNLADSDLRQPNLAEDNPEVGGILGERAENDEPSVRRARPASLASSQVHETPRSDEPSSRRSRAAARDSRRNAADGLPPSPADSDLRAI